MSRTTIAIACFSLAAALAALSCVSSKQSVVLTAPSEAPGLHNVLTFAPGVISGGAPDGSEGFDSLKNMGVQSIVSVDGIRPDVEAAEARGMRYAHIPIQYGAITDDQRLALAHAMRDLPRPIYVHCHHGKHRGPAAAVVGLVALDELDVERGLALMSQAETAPSYTGLWASARAAAPVSDVEMRAWRGELGAVAVVSGIARNMSEMDRAWDNLKLIRAAGWGPPGDHPDLVPASEAARVTEHFRAIEGDAASVAKPAPFSDWLAQSVRQAAELESALTRSDSARELDQAFEAIANSCKQCHARFRD